MPTIASLIPKLEANYPHLHFTSGDTFSWSPSTQQVTYNPHSPDIAQLLHEVAHALLGHTTYSRDLELLGIERDAWEYAQKTLSPTFHIPVTDDVVQEALDSYRDWLHARSRCPQCEATGIQKDKKIYRCLACGTMWRVNEARICALRRYITH